MFAEEEGAGEVDRNRLPDALAPLVSQFRWVLWKWETGKDGKPTKVPYRSNGEPASTSNPKTWTSFAAACAAREEFDGIGFVLTDSDIAAFDIDKCRNPKTGALDPWAKALVEKAGSYAEITPSKTGVRIIGHGLGPKVHRKLAVHGKVSCELYRGATRYITVTGDASHDAALANIDEHIDAVLAELDKKKQSKGNRHNRGEKDELPPKLLSMLSIAGSGGYPSRSELLFAFLAEALRKKVKHETIADACLDEKYRSFGIFEHCRENGGRDYVERQIANAEEKLAESGEDDRGDERPIITLSAGKLHSTVTQAEAALIAAHTPFYARGGELVKPIIEGVAAFRGRRTNVARLRPLSVDMLRDHLSRTARFQRFDKQKEKWVAANPPHEIAQTLLSRDGEWKFPKLTGLITTPTLRPDGSILSTPGYDPATGLLLMAPLAMPSIPECPNRDDAVASLRLLDDLLNEFPFADMASRAVALSALMTPVARGAMQCVPLHAFTAPEAGSGKSYAIDVASCIGTGEVAPVIAAGRTEEETEKRLAAELLTGQPIISIDNLNGDLFGDFLCQAIERPIIKPRILGRSETRRIDNTVTMFGNGNNFRLTGDLCRRVILCSLDANMERPELRQFRNDPVAMVLTDRGRYVAAVLTIVRAYLAEGCPNQCRPLASFVDWSRLVRSPLVWLGQDDPVNTMETARAEDPTRSALAEFVAAWRTVIGINKPITAGAMKKKACSTDNNDDVLYRAVSAVACAPGRFEIDTLRLARWLSRHKGRVVNGHKVHGETDLHSKQLVWWLAANTKPDQVEMSFKRVDQ